jgi:DNA replication initiation complex subunit (GINS family)
MFEQFRKWREKVEKANKEKDLLNRLGNIENMLFDEIETEESIDMFENVKSYFENRINRRLERINNEKKVIEKWKQLN